MPQTRTRTFRDSLAPFIRIGMIGLGVALCMLAAASNAGCTPGNGKYTTEHKNTAKSRMESLKAATEYQMSLQAFLANDLPKARRHVDVAIDLSETVARHHVLRGRILLEQNDLEQAVVSLRNAELLDPDNVEAQYYQGLLAERIDRRDEALRFYTRAAELDQTNAQYPIAVAEVLIDMDRVDEAQAFLATRQDAFRHSAGIQQTLGHIALLQGDKQRAEVALNEARLLAPDVLEVQEDLARVQFELEKYGEAEFNLRTVLKNEVFAQRRDLQHMRAHCLVALNRLPEARDLLVKLTSSEEGQTDVTAWLSLGQVAYELRDTSRLRVAFSRATSLAPDRPEGYVLRALHLQRIGDVKGAVSSWSRAVELDPSAQNLVALGIAQHANGNKSGAQRAFLAAQKADPRHTLAGRLAKEPAAAEQLAREFGKDSTIIASEPAGSN